MPLPTTILLLPAGAITLTLSLYFSRPIHLHNDIQSSLNVTPSAHLSPSLHTINPLSIPITSDSYSLSLSKDMVRGRNDEELLLAFTRGFFGGWVFFPERVLLKTLNLFGGYLVRVGFSGMLFFYLSLLPSLQSFEFWVDFLFR